MKKTKTTKKSTTSRRINRASSVNRKASVKKHSPKRKKNLSKKIGFFAISVSLVTLVVFLAVSLSSSIFPSASLNEAVLGSATDMMAPTSFSASVKNYRVNLVWDNMVDGDYQYLIWVYDTATKTYNPKAIGVGNAGIGTTVTYSLDQLPGTSVLYRVSSCVGCRFADDGSVTGQIGSKSIGVVASVPRIVAPTQLTANAEEEGIKLSWKAITGVDGYDIWRSTSLFGLTGYVKVGSVGMPGTFSAHHTYKSDGAPDIPIDVASPTSFTDKRVIPDNNYYYRVSAKKTVTPLTGTSSRKTVLGSQSATVSEIAAKINTPSFSVSNPDDSSTSVQLNIEVPKSNSFSGYILYCSKCPFRKARIVPGDEPTSKYITAKKVSTYESNNYYSYEISGLKPSSSYSFELTKYRVVGSQVIESDKTTRNIVTPAVSDSTISTTDNG